MYQNQLVGPIASECTWQYGSKWGRLLECGRSDEILAGRCGTGSYKDCPSGSTQAILCCKLDYVFSKPLGLDECKCGQNYIEEKSVESRSKNEFPWHVHLLSMTAANCTENVKWVILGNHDTNKRMEIRAEV